MTSNAANFLRRGWSASRSLLRAKLNLLLHRAVLRAQRSLWFFQFLDSPSGQDSSGSDLSELDDSYPARCECPDSLCDDADEVWSHAHREVQGTERWAHRPKPSAVCAQASVFLGVLRSPQNRLMKRQMSRECEGIFLARERRDAPTKDFARERVKDCTRSRTSQCLKVIRMCTRARLAGAARNSFLFSLLLMSQRTPPVLDKERRHRSPSLTPADSCVSNDSEEALVSHVMTEPVVGRERNLVLAVLGVSRAHFYGVCERDVYVEPPSKLHLPGLVAKIRGRNCGANTAAAVVLSSLSCADQSL